MTDDVVVLLAAYNGERYLQAQLDSILGSDYRGRISVLLGLDPSTDDSRAALTQYDSGAVEVIEHTTSSGSAMGNFSRLMCYASQRTENYFCLSDQDDVWLPRKLALGMEKLKALEQIYGDAVPLLVFSDAEVVDEKLRTIAASFWRYEKLEPDLCRAYKNLAVQNVAQGCTFVLNRALLEKVHHIPALARMHDHWMMLVAAVFGHIDYIDAPTLKYRQHSRNVLGSAGQHLGSVFRRLLLKRDSIRAAIRASENQALVFLEEYKADLSDSEREFFEQFSRLSERSFLSRRLFCARHALRMSSGLRTLGFYLFI